MMPLREWLKPPRSLLATLFLVTLVSVSALGWFGWKLLDQERLVEVQRGQEALEQSADRIVALAQGALAETGERLGSWLIAPPAEGKPEEGLLLLLSGNTVTAVPRQRLLYRPSPAQPPEATDTTFADGEVFEFQQRLPERAIELYRQLADSKNPGVRAGALVRMARVFRKTGHKDEARAVYVQLAGAGDEARVGGAPAELAARLALCELSGARTDAAALKRDLFAARWQLSRGQFEFYWSEASRLAGDAAPAPAEATVLSEVVSQGWKEIDDEQSPRGQSTIRVGGLPYLLMWRGTPGHRAVLVTTPASVLKQVFSDRNIVGAAVDNEGKVVAGRRSERGRAVVRTPAETQLPWTLYLTSGQEPGMAGILSRQRFLLLVTGLTVLFLITGAWFIARAIRGDLAVARMQSDFVSAVSHEFRSPLTSIRQLSEILALGRIPNEARRHVYYETLVRETIRLQRLVEALLNFGRMEEGVRRYRFESLDAVTLVSQVAGEFETQIAGSGRHIEIEGLEGDCTIDADPEALSVALRNLVDNALKYGPDSPTVWMECGIEKARVAIRVRDRGPGIPASEKKTIFRKFVRGSAAEAANVKGSGVGLAMVRHIVAAHGGDVTLASEPGSGSVFTISLPLGAAKT